MQMRYTTIRTVIIDLHFVPQYVHICMGIHVHVGSASVNMQCTCGVIVELLLGSLSLTQLLCIECSIPDLHLNSVNT